MNRDQAVSKDAFDCFDFLGIMSTDELKEIMQECDENSVRKFVPGDLSAFLTKALSFAVLFFKSKSFESIDIVSIAEFLTKEINSTLLTQENKAASEQEDDLSRIESSIRQMQEGSEKEKVNSVIVLSVIECMLETEEKGIEVTRETIRKAMTKLLVVFCWAYKNKIASAEDVDIVGKFFDMAYERTLA